MRAVATFAASWVAYSLPPRALRLPSLVFSLLDRVQMKIDGT